MRHCTARLRCMQGELVRVRVRWDAGQLHFAAEPPARRARHAFVPRWHFDMVLDEQARPALGPRAGPALAACGDAPHPAWPLVACAAGSVQRPARGPACPGAGAAADRTLPYG